MPVIKTLTDALFEFSFCQIFLVFHVVKTEVYTFKIVQDMKVEVWDTYIPDKQGDVLHFDIIVPEKTPSAQVYQFGNTYLNSIDVFEYGKLNSGLCQLCHIEQPSDEMLNDISKQGYYILPLGSIPANLPQDPKRSDYILHLRAFSPQYRFADFRKLTTDEVIQIYLDLTSNR